MIVVRVELWSARTGEKTELARMEITNNDGMTKPRPIRNYLARTLRGRKASDFARRTKQRSCAIDGFPATRLHIWNLVAAALTKMEYQAP